MTKAMQQIAMDINKELDQTGRVGNISVQIITSEIGALDLVEHGVTAHSFDLVTFIDMIGPEPKGDPSKWLLKAKELLKQQGYLIIDERDNWMIDALHERFPQHEMLSEGRYLMGEYEGSYSQNRFYRVKNDIADEDLSRGRTCPIPGHYPAVPARQGINTAVVAEDARPLSRSDWARRIKFEVEPFKDRSIFRDDNHRALIESALKNERIRSIRVFKQAVKEIFAPLQDYEGEITAEVIRDLFSRGSARFYRKLADYKIAELQYQITRMSEFVSEEDYLRGVLSPGAEQCDTVSSVIEYALSDILSSERVKMVHGAWYNASANTWESHFWVRIDNKLDTCFTYDQFDMNFWGKVLISRPEEMLSKHGLFELEEDPGKLFRPDNRAQTSARIDRLVKAIDQAETDREVDALIPLALKMADSDFLDVEQLTASLTPARKNHSRFGYVLDRLGVREESPIVAFERRKGARVFIPVKMGKEFDSLYDIFAENTRFSWGEGKEKMEAVIRYDGYRTIEIVPTEETKGAHPELGLLDLPADSALVPAYGSFGNIVIEVIRAGNEYALWIEEVQPSVGFREIKPLAKRQKFRDWNTAAVEHIVEIARKAGFKTIYASTETEIRQKFDNLNQGNVRENYHRPFRNAWEKVDIVLGRRQTKLWQKKIFSPLDAAVSAIKNAVTTEETNKALPAVVDGIDEGKFTFKEFLLELNREVGDHIAFARWIYVMKRMGVSLEDVLPAAERRGRKVFMSVKQGAKFDKLEQLILFNKHFTWGEGPEKAGALILYAPAEKALKIFPDRDTLLADPELTKLDAKADDAYVPDRGLFGVVRIQEMIAGEETILYIDEVQPSIGFRNIKPSQKREKYRDWNKAAVEHILSLARQAGFTVCYASTGDEIRQRYRNERKLNQGNLKENYKRPFKDKWMKTDVVVGRRQTNLWHRNLVPESATEKSKPEAPDMVREKISSVLESKPHEKFTVIKDYTSGALTCILNLFSDEGRPLGRIILRVEKEGIILYSCGGLDVNVRGEGYGAMLLLRGFARAFEEAQKNGMNPKWAYIYATIADEKDVKAIGSLTGFLNRFGFKDEFEIDIWRNKGYKELTRLVRDYPGETDMDRAYWFSGMRDLLDAYNERFGALLGTVKPANKTGAAEISEEPDIENVLRNLTDTHQLSQGLVEMILSVTFNRHLVLAFDSDIASCSAGGPMGLVDMLEKLKEDPRYKKILKNLVLIKASSAELPSKLEGYTDKEDTEVFMFALEDAREDLKSLESKVRPVYINEKDFPMSSYYPLAEIVAISLAQLFQEIIPDEELMTSLSYGAGEIDLEEMNIESVARDSNVLIFKLLPDAEPCDTGDLLKRYAKIKRFLKAA
jgi:hypothetical protein